MSFVFLCISENQGNVLFFFFPLIRLGRILGEVSRQLGSINPHFQDPPLETAIRLTKELEKWKGNMPPLFNHVRATSLIPPLCRQSQVLQLAYSHAMIHVTRSFLLNDFTDLRRRPSVPDPNVTNIVQKCILAAENVITLVDGLANQGTMIRSFWFTHYVCFCAIIVVYIYTIQQHQSTTSSSPRSIEDDSHLHYLFTLAEACQQHLAEATRKNCPSRRYSIILEELRREVHKQIGSPSQFDLSINVSRDAMVKSPQNQDTSLQNQFGLTSIDPPISLDSNTINYSLPPDSFQVSDSTDAPLDPMDDIGILENLDGPVWWAQLDSWVSISLCLALSTS